MSAVVEGRTTASLFTCLASANEVAACLAHAMTMTGRDELRDYLSGLAPMIGQLSDMFACLLDAVGARPEEKPS